MDFDALARGLAAGLAAQEDEISAFPADHGSGGNGNTSPDQSLTHVSHISHAAEMGMRSQHVDLPISGSVARAFAALASTREIISHGPVGNVGNVGSSSKINNLPFPLSFSEVGRRGECGKRVPRWPRPETELSVQTSPEPLSFDERAAFLEYECGLTRDQAEAQAWSELEVTAAATVANGLPLVDGLSLWRAGLALLSPDEAPCPDYRPGTWSAVHARALAFLDTFGPQAEALGWTAPRLFGVHPEIGTVRVDYCGGLVLGLGGQVHALTHTEIRFSHLTHRMKPWQPEGVPIWSFGQ